VPRAAYGPGPTPEPPRVGETECLAPSNCCARGRSVDSAPTKTGLCDFDIILSGIVLQ